MKHSLVLGRYVLVTLAAVCSACTCETPSSSVGASAPSAAEAPTSDTTTAEASADGQSAADRWWGALNALCQTAYGGNVTSSDAVDAELAGQAMVMHIRRCDPDRLEIPFHIGDNRSRTWVLTRTEDGVQLQHDHRHEDGSEDTVTLYGGHSDASGSEGVQSFPADDYSKELFTANNLAASVDNIWSMEIVPGQRFSYILRRPGRHFQADFDLSQPVDPPPAPWGHE